jgi:hypothetical protein
MFSGLRNFDVLETMAATGRPRQLLLAQFGVALLDALSRGIGDRGHELMAMFGRMTPQMASLYTRGAHRRKMALNAADRLLGTSGEHSMPAPAYEVRVPERITK